MSCQKCDGDAVAVPLVGELVDDDAVGADLVVEELLRVDRARLVLEREADARQVIDDAADVAERIRAEVVREELDDLGLACERACGRRSRSSGARRRAVPTVQSFVLPGLPAGAPGTVQPSSVSPSSSNEVLPSPVEVVMSSMKTPWVWTTSSLA